MSKEIDKYCQCKYPQFCPICGKEFSPEIESDNEWIKQLLTAYAEFVKETSEDCSIPISVDNFINVITSKKS